MTESSQTFSSIVISLWESWILSCMPQSVFWIWCATLSPLTVDQFELFFQRCLILLFLRDTDKRKRNNRPQRPPEWAPPQLAFSVVVVIPEKCTYVLQTAGAVACSLRMGPASRRTVWMEFSIHCSLQILSIVICPQHLIDQFSPELTDTEEILTCPIVQTQKGPTPNPCLWPRAPCSMSCGVETRNC